MKLFGLCLVLMLASEGHLWSINVTRRIQAQLGLSVVVPCTFTVPPESTDIKLFWKKSKTKNHFPHKDMDRNAFVYHPNNSFVMPKYRGKTSLLGQGNNCSLKIQNIQEIEPSIYLRITTKQDNYSFIKNNVFISIQGQAVPSVTLNPAEVTARSLPYADVSTTPATASASTEGTQTPTHTYVTIVVPLVAILLLAGVAGFLVYTRCGSLRKVRVQESLRYANFHRKDAHEDCKNETLKSDKDPPAMKNLDEPVYVNYSNQATHMAPKEEHTDHIYANVDFT
ncbi:uncharacterized protein LOC128771722 isoform X1 [Synchiropus splendidus]|uniref:uncharacterized protein LOC128771722 isoform X1 n=1 Tax=Synchiropus splendidus TaxID=270530 RepID=UPI00237D3BCF|nr:uncharacterized protein LOC128771722 isoform X1 [Synchiropus splendidus]XP_053743365.1 uncharacterized protein LOC128771722 isoform X1 [Synchiropus splendidus]